MIRLVRFAGYGLCHLLRRGPNEFFVSTTPEIGSGVEISLLCSTNIPTVVSTETYVLQVDAPKWLKHPDFLDNARSLLRVRYEVMCDEDLGKCPSLVVRVGGSVVDGSPFSLDVRELQLDDDFKMVWAGKGRVSHCHNVSTLFVAQGPLLQRFTLPTLEESFSTPLEKFEVQKICICGDEVFALGLFQAKICTVAVFTLSGQFKRHLFNKTVLGVGILENPLDLDVFEKTIFVLDNAKKTSKKFLKTYDLNGKSNKVYRFNLNYTLVCKLRSSKIILMGLPSPSEVHFVDQVSGIVSKVIQIADCPTPLSSTLLDPFNLLSLAAGPNEFYVSGDSGHILCFDSTGKFIRVLNVGEGGDFKVSGCIESSDIYVSCRRESETTMKKFVRR
eukprot:TRINITY_DN5516_c0_g3_i2.p1 TRINITY_DN5516_c0_g3~~TRINITY_DN5516_c0_g3_i2.p1  ORF type:complete len:388 (-),score=85.43 TRINITY_DN5516_c0_g3_i2:23-1186(-)